MKMKTTIRRRLQVDGMIFLDNTPLLARPFLWLSCVGLLSFFLCCCNTSWFERSWGVDGLVCIALLPLQVSCTV